MKQYLSIEEAKYVDNYQIYMKFNDGKENIIDFKSFIFKSHHPDITKYKNIDLFKRFSLEFGELEWNNYDLSFPIYDLYQGEIQ